tara:strand:+ start:501 stop:647 length:147 start_codon:yes stop_codon:yes gene_type:complete
MVTKKKKELTLFQKRNKDGKTWEMLCKEARKEWKKKYMVTNKSERRKK